MRIFSMLLLVTAFVVGCGKKDDSTTTGSKLTLKGSGTASGDVTAAEGVDAESLKVKVFALHVSESEDCSDPIEVFTKDDDVAEYTDFLSGPTLGEDELAIGEYPCVMIVMADEIKFTPAEETDNGVCEVDEEYSINVCREGSTHTMFDGEDGDCTDDEDQVTLYLSTVSEGSGDGEEPEECAGEAYDDLCSTFKAPSEDKPNRGINLGNALEIEASTSATFIVDGSGRVQEEEPYEGAEASEFECGMQPPQFSFE